jgi:hypothetical protein
MFRRKQDDEDPFAALKEAAERGTTHIGGARASAGAGSADSGGSAGGTRERRTEPRPLTLGDEPALLRVPAAPRSRRGSDRLLVLLFVLLALGGAGALVWQSERDADEQAIAASDRDEPGETSGSGDDDRARGDDERAREPRRADLLRPAGFRQALRRIRAELRPGERVWMLRVARDRINSLTALPGGDQRMVDVAADLSVTVREAGHAGSHTPLPLTRIDPRAPARALRGAVARGGMPASRFDYMVVSGLPAVFRQAPDWSLFFRDVSERNHHWTAPLSGAPVTRPGESVTTSGSGSTTTRTSSSSSLTITRNGRTTTLTGADAQRISDCIRRAGTDGAAIQRCLP